MSKKNQEQKILNNIFYDSTYDRKCINNFTVQHRTILRLNHYVGWEYVRSVAHAVLLNKTLLSS